MADRLHPRICLLTSEYGPFRGGIATYAREIGAAAAELGAEVTIWAPDFGTEPQVERDGDLTVRRFRGGLHRFQDMPRKFLTTWAATKPDYDIIHAADWPFYLPVAFLGRKDGVRKVATLHGTEINHIAHPWRGIVIDRTGWPNRFDTLLCNSHYTRDLFLSKNPGSTAHTDVTLLGVSDFWLSGQTTRETERAALGLTPTDRVVITVGRLTHRKGQDRTLAALEALPPALKERIVYLIVGPDIDVTFVDSLRATVASATVRVKIMGTLSDTAIRNLYAAADLFVLTGRQHGAKVEGFGLVFLEAAGSGLPSVGTKTGGVSDAILDGKTGVLAADESIPAITTAIQACLGDDPFRERLSRLALDYARHMSWRACAAKSYGLDDPGAKGLLEEGLPQRRSS